MEGYVARFGDVTTIAGEFRERIAQGAFARSLAERDVVMILDHDSGRVLGRVSAGTLHLKEDQIGLRFQLDVDETTPEGQTALGTVGRGDVSGCSFGFSVKAERWEDGGRRLPLRTITDLNLFECTLTAFPAYPTTSAAVVQDNGANARRRVMESKRRAEAAMRARGIPV
ncbi:HK97 family phage prohead protease [Devosia sp. MSA67]|uniref:HK97 family phage prohead protease n=1 Tax=Devosia sediminis TaxID=2798801 RepID=A0A934IVH2_9HYPH|nr:HK97 family phage prohead protease [Devosia sediminis]